MSTNVETKRDTWTKKENDGREKVERRLCASVFVGGRVCCIKVIPNLQAKS